ncbi:MAG: hypothetical protein ABIL09_24000 [Gemmatimonadota bacterium]
MAEGGTGARFPLVPFSQQEPAGSLFADMLALGQADDRSVSLPLPLTPPVLFEYLEIVYSASSILPQLGDAMASAVEGQGHDLVAVREADEDTPDTTRREMVAERRRLRRFFRHCSRPLSWTETLRRTRQDLEPTGWRALQVLRLPPEGWDRKRSAGRYQAECEGKWTEGGEVDEPGWGAERDPMGQIVGLQHIESHTLRYCEASAPVLTTDWLYEEDEDPDLERPDDPGTPAYQPAKAWRRFRLLVHARSSGYSSSLGLAEGPLTVGDFGLGVTYFREFGDPRIVDKRSGQVVGNYLTGDFPSREECPPEHWAGEILVDKLYSGLFEPYGRPRWFGVQETDQAVTSAAEANRHGIEDPTIPRLILTSEGSNTSAGDFDRQLDVIEKSRTQDPSAHFRVVLVENQPHVIGDEVMGEARALRSALNVHQIKVLPDDGLFVEFDEQGRKKVRSAFRLSTQSVGLSEDDSFASAQASMQMEDAAVVRPERDRWDALINSTVLVSLRAKWWRYQTKGRILVSPEDFVAALEAADKAGALTPNLVRRMLSRLLGEELDPVQDEWGDRPFSITLEEAKAMAGFGFGGAATAPADEEAPGAEEGAGAEKGAAPTDDDLVVALKGLRRYLEAKAKAEGG